MNPLEISVLVLAALILYVFGVGYVQGRAAQLPVKHDMYCNLVFMMGALRSRGCDCARGHWLHRGAYIWPVLGVLYPLYAIRERARRLAAGDSQAKAAVEKVIRDSQVSV